MRHITLTTATLAVLAFAGAAYADSNYGPRQNGNQCWHQQLGNSLGYWSPAALRSIPEQPATPGLPPTRTGPILQTSDDAFALPDLTPRLRVRGFLFFTGRSGGVFGVLPAASTG